jgi:hypothetical protein
MRTLKGQNLVHDNNYVKFPDGAIQNEIEGTQEGTPVVREVYNDFLMNVYAYMRQRGIVPNEIEDSANNGYQFINALKRNVNDLNDTEKILNIDGSTWNINIDFSLVPTKYFLFARAAEDYNAGVANIKGTGPTLYPFSSTGFKTGDELLIILDQANVRSYNLSNGGGGSSQGGTFATFGTPVQYLENSNKIWYEKNGHLYSDFPENYNLKEVISAFYSDTAEVKSIGFHEGRVICLAYLINNLEIKVCSIDPVDVSGIIDLPSIDHPLNGGIDDYNVHMYMDQEFIYLTNDASSSINDNLLACYKLDLANNQLDFQANYTLSNTFVKTNNAVAYAGGIVTFYEDELIAFYLNGSVSNLGNFPNFAGNLFRIATDVYYTDGSNAVKWTI